MVLQSIISYVAFTVVRGADEKLQLGDLGDKLWNTQSDSSRTTTDNDP